MSSRDRLRRKGVASPLGSLWAREQAHPVAMERPLRPGGQAQPAVGELLGAMRPERRRVSAALVLLGAVPALSAGRAVRRSARMAGSSPSASAPATRSAVDRRRRTADEQVQSPVVRALLGACGERAWVHRPEHGPACTIYDSDDDLRAAGRVEDDPVQLRAVVGHLHELTCLYRLHRRNRTRRDGRDPAARPEGQWDSSSRSPGCDASASTAACLRAVAVRLCNALLGLAGDVASLPVASPWVSGVHVAGFDPHSRRSRVDQQISGGGRRGQEEPDRAERSELRSSPLDAGGRPKLGVAAVAPETRKRPQAPTRRSGRPISVPDIWASSFD
jgi:hypothetical protein